MRTRSLLLAALFVLLGINTAAAGTDFACVSDCTARGYLYQYCVANCSYADALPMPAPAFQPHGTDFGCVNACTNRGYLYEYCAQACSY